MQKEVITVVTAFLLLSPGMAAQHGSFSYSIDKPWLTEVYVDDYYYGADSIGQCLMRVDYAMEIMVDTVQGTAVEQMMALEIGNNVSRLRYILDWIRSFSPGHHVQCTGVFTIK